MGNHRLVLAALILIASACGPDHRNGGPTCTGTCSALGYAACNDDGSYDPPQACTADQTCDPARGCITCVPDELYCAGNSANDVYRCNSSGTDGELVEACTTDSVCSGGACKTPCEAAEDHPSNVGCEFWAADLDNESSQFGDAAAQQMAIVVANNNAYPVTATVTINKAGVGAPLDEMTVSTTQVPPRGVSRIDLPQREIDGSMGQNGTYAQNSGSGTFVSPHAFHVVTSGPVVIYQFNPIIQAFSNDASTLIPKQALGSDYIISGFETANPCSIAGLGLPGIPDHGAVTIIPIQDDTHVTVTTAHAIKASGANSGVAIPMTAKGDTLTLTLGRYMVANLESEMVENGSVTDCAAAVSGGKDGDFTGTYIKADKPVVVFTSNERGDGLGGATNIVNAPGWDNDMCCTDHLEEQLFPVTALGKEFAIARSPLRSTDPSWKEPDIIRVVGTVDNTVITTNLPPPNDSFVLGARADHTFGATTGFAMSASAPIQVTSYLVPQHFIPQGGIGDASQLLLPAAEQFRKEYVFLVPATFTKNYGVLARPVGSTTLLDGLNLDGVEFSTCVKASIGMVAGVDYEQLTCPLTEGKHAVTASVPFGLSVYGYYNVGSYAFVGGSDVKIINPIL